MAIYKCSSEPV